MHFRIDPQIFKDYQGVRIGVIVLYGCSNKEGNKEAYAILEQAQNDLKKALTKEQLAAHPYILAWHNAYKKFGANPKKYLSSVENVATRVLKGGTMRSINTIVDLYNTISLKYLLPLGGEDLDTMQGDLRLAIAGYDEPEIKILGDEKPYKPSPGEVFYKDDAGAVCCRWNWREADRTKLTSGSKNAIIVIDTIAPVDRSVLTDALNELALLCARFAGGTASVAIVDEQNPIVFLKKNNSYVPLESPGKVADSSQFVYKLTQEELKAEQEAHGETKIRIEKIDELRKQGIEPWPESVEVPNTCKEIIEEFGTAKQRTSYAIAGRLTSIRIHGKTIFADLQDREGTLQLYLKQDQIGEQQFAFFEKFIDLGDIISASGKSFKTKMGEITLDVDTFQLLSKCVHPLPEKFHGLTDVEVRYRQRYLDLISNPDSREKFKRRTAIIKNVRSFLDSHQFLEVETPMLHPIAGGAAARPFVTHHNALNSDFYLRIAPELYLKRLVVGGFERVYEINRNFRNEGVSTRHNPEFTMLEFYMTHHDYHFIMGFVEELIRFVAQQACGTMRIAYGEHIIAFDQPFKRLSVEQAVKEIGGFSAEELKPGRIDATLEKQGIRFEMQNPSRGQKIFALFEHAVESKLIQPTFITDYPIEISPLAKRDSKNPEIAARYELFVGGMELSNGFNELNDPFDQADRFHKQVQAHKAGDPEAHQFDADYVTALEYGLPPTVGVGIGIDRLVMLLTNTQSIKDVILFPTLKKK